MKTRIGLFFLCVLCLGSVGVAADPPTDSNFTKYAVDIPAQALSDALQAFALASGHKLLYSSDLVAGKTSPALKGQFTTEEGVRRLLANTGLKYEVTNNGLVMIRAASAVDPPGGPQKSASDQAGKEGKKPSSQDFRVAQVDQTPAGNQGVEKNEAEKRFVLQEIVVTGTHLRDTTNPTAPLNVITRDDIDHAGFATTQQLTASLPQNFGGGQAGASEDGNLGSGFLGSLFSTYGTAINLRGLGESSTLVLVNGRRLAPSNDGLFVDISAIPLAAIDRVEIVTDGASAVYGSDAVAGVVNFILRKNYDGQESWASYAPTFDGSRGEQTLGQSIGRNWASGNVVATVQYQKQDSVSAADRSYTDTAVQPTNLLPKSAQYSGILSLSQDLSSNLQLAADALVSHKYADGVTSISPNAGGYTIFNWTAVNSGVASLNLGYHVPDQWHIDASTAYARETTAWNYLFVNDPFNTCPNNACQYHDAYTVWSNELGATGTLFHAPGGDVKLALGGSYRNESISLDLIPPNPLGTPYDRHVFAEYLEMEAPIFSGANAQTMLRELVLSLAVRHDEYSDFGSTTNPRYGLAWKPADEVRLRGAYSTSFRAPSAYEALENSTHPTILFQLPFSSPAGVNVPVFEQVFGGPQPGPERSRNITAGIEFEPFNDKSLKASLDYFDIRYRDRIVNPSFPANVLSQLSAYGPLISTLSSDAAAQAFANQIVSSGGLFANFSGMPDYTGVRYLLKSYEQNAALVTTTGLDFALNDRLKIGANEFRLDLNATYLSHIDTSYSDTSTPTDLVNTYANPLHWRARAQLTWLRGAWSATGAVNYTGHHDDTTTAPFATIASWTTIDAQVAYTPVAVKGLTLSLSALNVFDRDPPYVAGADQLANTIHYEVGNANPLGRQVILSARFAW